MHITRNTLSLLLGVTAPALTLHAQERPGSVLDRAIRAAGGEATLKKYRRIEWAGLGVVHIPNRDIVIRGWWDIQPPDSAVVDTYDTTRGPGTTRTLILSGPRGWLYRDTVFTPLPEDLLAEEQHQYYLYSLLRLVPLKDKGVKLRPVFPDSMGNAGFTVERAGRLPVTMYFDSAGRVMRLVTRFALPGPVAGDAQVVLLHGTAEAEGLRWFRRIEILRAGKPYFDMEIDSLKAQREISDSLLTGPPRQAQ
jgi:hypothetical protein